MKLLTKLFIVGGILVGVVYASKEIFRRNPELFVDDEKFKDMFDFDFMETK